MKELKANTICRHCGKEYYSCYHCIKTQNWRSICCSLECYQEYQKAILESRGISVTIPKRTDMTETEVVEFITETPEEVAIEKTKEELSEYIKENPDMSLNEVVEKVNLDIKKKDKK